jgi:hypothetical protein
MTRARTDANQTRIVKALRAAGCFVQSLAEIGKGCPDLLVIRAGRICILEIKDGDKCPSAQKLTGPEIEWHTSARAYGYQVPVVTCVKEALRAVGMDVEDYR